MKADEFLDRVKERLGSNRQEADRQARAVLAVVAEQVSSDEGFDLASQLPGEFKDVVISQLGYSLHRGKMSKDYLVGRVQVALGLDKPGQAERVTRGVLSVLPEAITPGQLEDIVDQLPPELRAELAVPQR